MFFLSYLHKHIIVDSVIGLRPFKCPSLLFFSHSWALDRMSECQTYVKLSEEKLIPK